MNINAERLVDKLTEKVAELTLRTLILETQIEEMMKGGMTDGQRPDGNNHGNVGESE